MYSMKQLLVGIIGQGRSGRDIHARSIRGLPEHFRIAAVSDPLEERRARAKEELHCETFADYRDMLKMGELDLIVNATPSHMHVPVSLEGLESGFHVLCEKPLARRVSDVDRLIEASRTSHRHLAIFQQSRYSPAYQQILKLIEEDVIGRVIQVSIAFNGFARRWDWQTQQEKNGGNLLNTGPHPVDQAVYLFGTDTAPDVTCVMDRANAFGDAEDYVKIILRGPGKPVIDVEISSCSIFPVPTYRIQGTRGGIQGTATRLEWKSFKAEEAPDHNLIEEPLSNPDGTPAYCSEQLQWYEDSWEFSGNGDDLFQAMAHRFYKMLHRSIVEGKELEITPEQVRRQIQVMEACFAQNPDFALRHRF
jgi:scyllo-inositol 2-dehydrogenase (NADP+)